MAAEGDKEAGEGDKEADEKVHRCVNIQGVKEADEKAAKPKEHPTPKENPTPKEPPQIISAPGNAQATPECDLASRALAQAAQMVTASQRVFYVEPFLSKRYGAALGRQGLS